MVAFFPFTFYNETHKELLDMQISSFTCDDRLNVLEVRVC